MTLLQKSQKVLREQAIELYNIYAEDLPLEKEEFERHYSSLGKILFEIESMESFSQLISKLEKGDFSVLGHYPGDEDMVEEFLISIEEAQ